MNVHHFALRLMMKNSFLLLNFWRKIIKIVITLVLPLIDPEMFLKIDSTQPLPPFLKNMEVEITIFDLKSINISVVPFKHPY